MSSSSKVIPVQLTINRLIPIIPYFLMIAKLYKVRNDFNLAVYNFGSC